AAAPGAASPPSGVTAAPDSPELADAARDPARAKALLAKGDARLAEGKLADARQAYLAALGADARSAAALGGLADVAYERSDWTRAVLLAKRAVALAPRAVAYRMALARAFYKLMRYDDAIAQWKKVLEIEPGHPAAKKNIALARELTGR
ncbi:MAG TPA: tetratricopeptide repeat protein, partial [Myxococcota bacterium]|nr:tetratricopeptide repeat protein [Myxococcota bacterium]